MRYFVGFMITIGLIIVLIFMLFRDNNKTVTPTTHKTLSSYAATDAEVSLLIDGPVNAEQDHQQIRVTVDRNNVTFQFLTGYDGTVANQQQFPNTQTAYDSFLTSLGRAGYTRGDTNKALQDERGYCALGDRYIFSLRQDGEDIQRYWATSCGGTKTYRGNFDLTTSLFKAQVPEYETLTQKFNF